MPLPADTVDIAVIGGGLGGLVAALTLARTGRSVALFAPPRPADGRTTALLGDSVTALRELGLWPQLQPAAAPLRGIRLVDATGRLLRAPELRFDAAELGLDAFGHNVPNTALLSALDGAVDAAGVRRYPALVTAIRPLAEGVEVVTADQQQLTARLAVGADGRASPTRSAAGIAIERVDHPQAALVADFAHDAPHDDTSTEFHTAHGPFTLVPLPGRRSALVWVTEPGNAARMRELPAAELASVVERQAQSFLGAMTLEGRAQTFPLSSAAARSFAAPRIVLIGEAAHVLPPIAAQGFNVTLGDIAVLTELVRDAGPDAGDASVTEGYDRRRRPAVAMRAAAVAALNRSLLSDFLPWQGLRGAGLYALDRSPFLRRVLMRQGLGAVPATGQDARAN